MKKVGVLGSGVVGETLANAFLKYGHETMRGSREPAKLADWKAKAGDKAFTGTFAETASFGDFLVLAVAGPGAEAALDQAGDANLAGKTILDATNPISGPPVDGVLPFFTDHSESLMEKLQKKHPQANLVKCFSSTGAHTMVNPDIGGTKPSMFICGNDEGAKATAKKVLGVLGWEAEDMGGVTAARAIEPLCILWCIPGFRENSWKHAFKVLR